MKNLLLLGIFSLLFISCSKQKNEIPILKKMEKDIYFEQTIEDSYRYMENIQDTLVIEWLKKKKEEEKELIYSLENRNKLLANIDSLGKLKPVSISKIRIADNDSYFYLKKKSPKEVSKLYYRKSINGEEKLLYDPTSFKTHTKKKYSINYLKPSWDSSKVLISLTESDKEISEMIILDVSSKKVYPQILDHCWPSELGGVKWLPDNSGFVYVHLPVIDKNSKRYLLNTSSVLYKIGDNPKQLRTLFSKKDYPKINIKEEDFCEVEIRSSNAKYMFSHVSGASQYTDCYYAKIEELGTKKINWQPLFSKRELIPQFYTDGDDIIFRTSKGASNYKICKTSLKSPDIENPTVLVSEDKLATITDMAITNKGLFFVKTTNGVDARLFNLNRENKVIEIILPKAAGYINVFSKGYKHKNLWIKIEGWLSKNERFQYDYRNKKFIKEELQENKDENKIDDIIVEEIEIASHDGIMVPLSIIYKKGIKKNNSNRLLINAYGAYGWSNSPYPYSYLLHWVKEGGIYAVAHVRGGGEKGEVWHKAGFKITKPNTWKDLIACTEYLIKEKYTTPSKVAVWSASAGGVCVGRAITERPDLYAAGIIRVGLLNTLRLEAGANGANNTKEFGTIKDSIEFKSLLKMDSYHSIKENVKYPAVYLTAGLNDARVPAWHTAKFAARMQSATSSSNPVLLSVDFEGGHGFDVSQNKRNEELANILSFALWQTGHPDYQIEK